MTMRVERLIQNNIAAATGGKVWVDCAVAVGDNVTNLTTTIQASYPWQCKGANVANPTTIQAG
jgi:hypothetical protein